MSLTLSKLQLQNLLIMKKTLLYFSALFISVAAFAQPCVPDTSYNSNGIYPINGTSTGFYVYMPDAQVGVAYNEIVQIKAPSDTMVKQGPITVNANIDSLRILSFNNLPASITYVCDNARCLWLGGANGCATFTGTPTAAEVGNYVVDIVAMGWVDLGVFGTISDTILFTMEIKVVPAAGIDEFISSSSVKVTPNPFSDVASFSFQAVKSNDYKFDLIDITGRTVRSYAGKTALGNNEIMLERQGLPNGMYFFSLKIGNEVLTGRIAVTR